MVAAGLVGLARIEVHGAHYQPSDEGQPAVVLPILDADREIIDLAAFEAARPDRIAALLRDAGWEVMASGSSVCGNVRG